MLNVSKLRLIRQEIFRLKLLSAEKFNKSERATKNFCRHCFKKQAKVRKCFLQNPNRPTATKNKKDEPGPVIMIAATRGGQGQENGRGSGAGNGTTPKIPPTTNPQTSPLKILSKPRASYTNLARFYQIAGKVRLGITFLAKGGIGAVTPVAILPFGLTDAAMNAARGIKFTPAIKDGKSYEVAEFVEYNFVIY